MWFEVKVPVRLSKFESLMSFHDPRATNEKALISSSVLKEVRLKKNMSDFYKVENFELLYFGFLLL